MIGNDIIDIKAASRQSNINRPGFLKKLFSAKEQECIHCAEDPRLRTWIYWSMKESAYKAHQRRFNLPRKFNPRDFNCEITGFSTQGISGKTAIGSYSYETEISLGKEYIHCTAGNHVRGKLYFEVFSNLKDLQLEILMKYSAIKNLQLSKLSIVKDRNSIPQLFYNGEDIHEAFSISHHGKFSAYLLPLINY